VRLEIRRLELLLILEEDVVVLPELALVGGAEGRLGGLRRMRVEAERELPVHEPHLPRVAGHHLLHRVVSRAAVRALEVRELHDGHPRVLGPAGRTFRRHRDPRLRQVQLEVRLLLELADHLLHLRLPLLAHQRLADAVLQRLERRLRRDLAAALQPVEELPLLRLGGLLHRRVLDALADVVLLVQADLRRLRLDDALHRHLLEGLLARLVHLVLQIRDLGAGPPSPARRR
jgi:hypothetical protein